MRSRETKCEVVQSSIRYGLHPGSKWCDGDNARNYMSYLYGSSGATVLESVDPYIGAPGKCPATSNLAQQPVQKLRFWITLLQIIKMTRASQ